MKEKKINRVVRSHTWVTCRICYKSGNWKPGDPEICEHRKEFKGLMPDDFIERVYWTTDKINEYGYTERCDQAGNPVPYKYGYTLTFPFTLCIDGCGCGGYTSIYVSQTIHGKEFPGDINDPELAWMLSLIQWANNGAKHFDNCSPLHNLCNCESNIIQLKILIDKMPIISLGSWERVGGIAHRGIHDYKRIVVVSKPLNQSEEEILKRYIDLHKNPGYCSKTMLKENDGYIFTSTMDSSD